jgi:predicted phosphodiesterase
MSRNIIGGDISLKLLIISDIHMAFSQLEKLKDWYFNFNQDKFDFVICPGDFENMEEGRRNLAKCKEAEGKISSVLSFVEFLSVPILYVPGNHDPITMFETEKKVG